MIRNSNMNPDEDIFVAIVRELAEKHNLVHAPIAHRHHFANYKMPVGNARVQFSERFSVFRVLIFRDVYPIDGLRRHTISEYDTYASASFELADPNFLPEINKLIEVVHKVLLKNV